MADANRILLRKRLSIVVISIPGSAMMTSCLARGAQHNILTLVIVPASPIK
jgi:hypothetical protein